MYPVIGRGWPETLSIRFISPPSIRLNGNAHIPLLRLFLFSFSLRLSRHLMSTKTKSPPTLGREKKKTLFEAALNKNVRFQFSPRPAAHSSRRKLRFQPHQAFFFSLFFPFFFSYRWTTLENVQNKRTSFSAFAINATRIGYPRWFSMHFNSRRVAGLFRLSSGKEKYRRAK